METLSTKTTPQPRESTVAALGTLLRMEAERAGLPEMMEGLAQELGAAGGRIWWRVRAEFPIRHWLTVGGSNPMAFALPLAHGDWAPLWQDEEHMVVLSSDRIPEHLLSSDVKANHVEAWALIPSGTRARGVAVFWFDKPTEPLPEIDRELLREALSANAAQIWWRERWAQRKLERELLDETGRLLAQSFERDDVLGTIFGLLGRVVQFDAGGIFLIDRESNEVADLTQFGYDQDRLNHLHLKIGQGLVGHVAKTGERVNVSDVSQDERYVSAREETRSALVIPIDVRERRLGVLNLESNRRDAFDANDEWLVRAFAHQVAIALDRAELFDKQIQVRRMNEQIAVARTIQQSFLPQKAPQIEGFDLAGANFPSEEVGGDYFDFVPIVPGQWGIAIADVSGKGIPAALIMSGFRASLIAEIRNNFAIRTILRKVNNVLKEMTPRDNFITAFYGVLDAGNRMFTYSNAGHNPPLLFRAGGKVERLQEGGPLVGVIADARYDEVPVRLGSGDLVLMYTDGVTEGMRGDGEEFGERRLIELVQQSRHLNSSDLCQRVHQAVSEFSGGGMRLDDLTLVALQVH
jgi:sigma-B regulation protein RsbU (phosphoserine phosphatase)